MSDLDKLEQRLGELRYERDAVANTRTKEDVRALVKDWLTAALARTNGSTGYVLGQHAGPAEIAAVLSEYLLASKDLVDFITAKAEAQAELTNKQRTAKLKALDSAIVAAEGEAREAAKLEALREVEARFAGEAA